MKIRTHRLTLTALALSITVGPIASANLLVGYHSFDKTNPENADYNPNGFLTSFNEAVQPGDNSFSSSSRDGTYGPTESTFETGGNGRVVRADGSFLLFENNSLNSLSLTSLLFDGKSSTQNAVGFSAQWFINDVEVGSINPISVFGTSDVKVADTGNDYADFFVDLGHLFLGVDDVFKFQWATDPAGGNAGRLDNIALTGIPETGSLAALALLVGSGTFMRSRRRMNVTQTV